MHTKKIEVSMVIGLLLMPLLLGLMFTGSISAIESPSLNDTEWKNGIIDTQTQLDGSVSMAIDNEGYLHVSYYDSSNSNLRYATNSGGNWSSEVVDSSMNVGKYNSIAVDSTGTVHISYYDASHYVLKYAHGNLDTWTTRVIDSTNSVGEFNSIVVDADDKVHITYKDDTSDTLKYATNEDGSWQMSVIAEDMSEGNSLGIDSNGMLFTAFVKSDYALYVMLKSNNSWTEEKVADVAGRSLDTANEYGLRIMVTYVDTIAQRLKVAVRGTDGEWQTSLVNEDKAIFSSPGMIGLSLTVAGGDIHVTYYSLTEQKLYYTNVGESTSVIDDDGGKYSAAVADENGKLHVVYIGGEISPVLKYVTNAGAKWVTETVDSDGDVGEHSSLAIDADGNVHIAYFDNSNGSLNYALYDGTWNIEVVDNSSAKVGLNPSLVLDDEGYAHISYYDDTNVRILKYATNREGSWTNNAVDSIGNVGSYSSIGVDENGSAYIVYFNNATRNLRFASIVGGDLTIGSLDSTNSADGPTALAVGANGTVHVAYLREAQLIYANNSEGSWAPLVLDTSEQLGGGLSIALSDSGKCYISYFDETAGNLKYINNAAGDWGAIETIDIPGTVGYSSVIKLDSKGEVHILYTEGMNNAALKYAEQRDGIWLYQKIDVPGCGLSISLALDDQDRGHVSYYDYSERDLGYATSLSPPGPVTNLTAIVSSGQVLITWNAPANDGGSEIVGYEIMAGSTPSSLDYIDRVDADTTELYMTGLTNGEEVYYRVDAWTEEGVARSEVLSAVPCDLPGSPSVDADGRDKAVKLSWDAPDNGGADITAYNIYKKNDTGVFKLLTTVSGSVTEYTDTGLENGQEYSYYVTAVNPAGEGPESATVTATANPSNDMIIIAVVIIIIAAAAIGAVLFLRSKGKL